MTDISQQFVELGIKQAAICRENPVAYIATLVSANSQRLIMMNVYRSLIQNGLITKIEDLEESTKIEYWRMAVGDGASRLDKDKLKTLATCYYCLDYLLSNY